MGKAEWWAEFKIFEDRDGSYSWQLQAASGRIIARSGHTYESKYWCEQDVNWLRANADQIMCPTTPKSRQDQDLRGLLRILAVFCASWRRDSSSVESQLFRPATVRNIANSALPASVRANSALTVLPTRALLECRVADWHWELSPMTCSTTRHLPPAALAAARQVAEQPAAGLRTIQRGRGCSST